MRSDPSETGGLFVGRRPGTGPLRFRGSPEPGKERRQRADGTLANAMWVGMVVLSLFCWGPIPLGCLWVGAHVSSASGSISLGILAAFVTLGILLFGTLALLRRLDFAWILVRRAAGHDQRSGVLPRIFAVAVVICGSAFMIWLLLIHGPGSTVAPNNQYP
jgi:hypothetical protein